MAMAACRGAERTSSRGRGEVATSSSSAPPAAPATGSVAPPGGGATASGSSCPVPPRAAPRPDRPRYSIRLRIDPATGSVDGSEDVEFTPDLATDHLVFRLWANSPRTARAGVHEDVAGVRQDAAAVPTTEPDPTTLLATPPRPLDAGRQVSLSVPFHLVVPGPADDRVSRSGDTLRMGSFFPLLAWEPGTGWATEPPVSGFAEASTAPAADITLEVTVPAGYDVLATGVPDGAGHWSASGVRDAAVSVGHFATASATIHVPDTVQVTVGVAAGVAEPAAAYLARVVSTLEDDSGRFGPYPWPAFTMAVEPALRGGIEYPMHVMQGPGTIGRTTPHEVGHQWFYGLVGNDQGRDPWLDEGLASWAEARHESTLAAFVRRAVPPAGRGHLGEAMTYWTPRQAIYYAGVYVQGVQALAALGPSDRVDCALRIYAARNAYRIARPADLLDATTAVFADAASTLARFGVHR